MLACLLVISLSLVVRFIIWIYPGYGWGNLTIYDVHLYTSYGRKFVNALSKGDFLGVASIRFGGPPLGILLTGLCSYVFEPFIDEYKAGLLAPIISSSFTISLIYLILRNSFKLPVKYAAIGSLIASFDPYLVQFSAAYLDSIGAFFLFVAIYTYLRFQDLTAKRYILIGLLISLAGITKFSFLIFALFFALLLGLIEKDYKGGLSVFLASLSLIPLIPWIWFGKTLSKAVARNLAFNSLLPPIIFGPITIGIPEAYPWYILTYFGMGQIHWNVLPSLSHFLLFCGIFYRLLNRNLRMTRRLVILLLAAILMVAFIPRNYWTTSWGGGAIMGKGILLKQFYPYYFYFTNLVAGLVACSILFLKSSRNDVRNPLAIFLIMLYCLTAPFVTMMNAFYPYWDFIFTLIFNFSAGHPVIGKYGLQALLITIILCIAFFILITIMMLKRLSKKE